MKELSQNEIKALPYIHSLLELPHGTLVLWQDFDVLEKSSGGMVYDALVELKESVANNIALIFHNFLSAKGKGQIKMYLNKGRIKPMDPFLESHSKTTTKKARSIAIRDSKGQERQIWVKPYILPFATDLNDPSKVIAEPSGLLIGPRGEERVGDVSNVVFTNGAIVNENNEVFIYYASSDTRMHVATTTVDKLVDYVFNTPQDPGRSVECVAQRCGLIEKNLEFLAKENK